MSRFTKIGADGAPSPDDATEWSAVQDTRSNLMWTKDDVVDADLDYEDAKAAVAKLNKDKFLGFDDWTLPEVEDLFCLADRSRECPAIDTDFFPTCKNDWYWTKTPDASSSDCAWIVYFGDGRSNFCHRSLKCRVRACRRVRSPSQ